MPIMVYNYHHFCQQNCTERLWYLATVSAHYEKIDKNSAKFFVLTSLQKTHFSMALQKTTISGMRARSGFFTSQVCFEDEWANQSKVDKTQQRKMYHLLYRIVLFFTKYIYSLRRKKIDCIALNLKVLDLKDILEIVIVDRSLCGTVQTCRKT